MPATWLLLDANYLMNRAFYAMGGLKHGGEPTGALYGFFRDLAILENLFVPDCCIFAFDAGYEYRLEIFPDYKKSRRTPKVPYTEDEKKLKAELSQQIQNLRTAYLPRCGYRNVLAQRGFEADDIIAAAARALPPGDEGVIVSSDADMWQLVTDDVWCYNPATRKATTHETFLRDWGLPPAMWPNVKALAGCDTDDVPGIDGVGEKTAAQWYRRELKDGSARRVAIEAGLEIHNRNIKLVRLPAPGLEPLEFRPDTATREKKQTVYEELGFDSLVERSGGFK